MLARQERQEARKPFVDECVIYIHKSVMDVGCRHTIAELHTFRRSALTAGLTEADIDRLIEYLAANPDAGEVMQGTGGCRKLRFSIGGTNTGKRGGVRTITLYTGADLPVFLITVFAKGKKVTLTKAERNMLKALSTSIVDEYAGRVHQLAAGGTR